MKFFLQQNLLLIAMTILSSIAILLKCILSVYYQSLLRDIDKIYQTKHKWLKHLKRKYESTYQIKLPVNDIKSFIEINFEDLKILGIKSKTFENSDIFFGVLICTLISLNELSGIFYKYSTKWLVTNGIALVIFLFFLYFTEALFKTRQKRNSLIVHLENYFSNTLHPKFQKQYIELPEIYDNNNINEKEKKDNYKKTEENNLKFSADMQELIDSLLTESKLDQKIDDKEKELATAATKEKYKLIEDILKEYM